MALKFTRNLRPAVTVFDCMDELSAFAFAPPELLLLESELLGRADLVFTGGRSLYEAKRKRHPDVSMPSEQRRRRSLLRARAATSVIPPTRPGLRVPASASAA